MSKSVKLPVKIETGKKTYMPGEAVPLSKEFGEKDVARIEAVHGKYVEDATVSRRSDQYAAAMQALSEENERLRAVIAGYEAVDEKTVAATKEGAGEAENKALDAAMGDLAEARKAAKL